MDPSARPAHHSARRDGLLPLRPPTIAIATPAPLRSRRLDGLRGLAVVLVIFGHEGDYSLGHPLLGEIGAVGVLLFFIFSGFLITGLLYREVSDTGRIDLYEFYVRRGLRILPAFWTLIGITSLLMLLGLVTDVTWKAVLACLFFVRNIRGRGQSLAHIWSLSLQEQFYAIWPFIMSRLGIRRSLWAAAFLVVAGTIWRGYAIARQLYVYETQVFYLRTDFRLDSIIVGCWIALALHDDRIAGRLVRVFRAVPLLMSAPLLFTWALWASEVVALRPVFITVETILACLAFGRFVVSNPSAIAVRICEHPALVRIGLLSFSLYLWQQLFSVTHIPRWGPIREFPLNLVFIVAAALVSNRFIERPALALRRRWSRGRSGNVPVAAGA